MPPTTLTTLDYLIIGIPLVIVLIIGTVMRRYLHGVADFLAANRCAGRYLICSATAEVHAAAMITVMNLETTSRTGFSMGLWGFFGLIAFTLNLFGVVTYRYRQTRCLTFHQFLELRYSKGLRLFATYLNIFSGLINFGLIPAVGGRFFVYFCGLSETMPLLGFVVPTYVVVMFVLMFVSLLLAITGGQISVMVTDCVEGLISGIFYLVVAFFILMTVSIAQMKVALLSGPHGQSYINPFDINQRPDFDGWYVFIGILINLYIFRGAAWNQASSAAAKTAHEGKMAGILGAWRGHAAGMMGTLVALGAFTILHNPAFAAQKALVDQGLMHVEPKQLQTEMSMPLALGLLLMPGIKGCFCAIALFGVLSSQGGALHGYGSTLMQDGILPLLKKQLSPKAHLFALRLACSGIALFACVFSIFYKPVDYLTFLTTLIGAIYLGGIGAVVWGGLYWKKGTAAAAWTSMVTGASLAIFFNVLQQFWVNLYPLFMKLAGTGTWLATWLAANPDKCPINGQRFTLFAAICSLTGYIVVSLLTCKEDFNMDRMLHRGAYAIASEEEPVHPLKKGFLWGKLIGIDEHYSWGDKVLAVATVIWALAWQVVAIVIIVWCVFIQRLSDSWFFNYMIVTGIWIPTVLALVTTVWFTIGTTFDMIRLLKTLTVALRNDKDDGRVQNHHNVGDPVIK